MPYRRWRCDRAVTRKMRPATLPRRHRRPEEAPGLQSADRVARCLHGVGNSGMKAADCRSARSFVSSVRACRKHIVKRVGGRLGMHRHHPRLAHHQFRGRGEQGLPDRVSGHPVLQEVDDHPARIEFRNLAEGADEFIASGVIPAAPLPRSSESLQASSGIPARFDRRAGREWRDSRRSRDSAVPRPGSEAWQVRFRGR